MKTSRSPEHARPQARLLAAAGAAALGLAAAAAAFGPGAPAALAATTSTPAITVAGGNSVIAVQTSGDGLRFYWNQYGTNTWRGEQVAVNGTTFSSPTIAQDGNSVIIAAQGVNNSLDFCSPIWNPETVPDTTVVSLPAITPDGMGVKTVAQGQFDILDTSTDTSGIWQTTDLTHGTGLFPAWGIADAPPTVTINNGSENIATFGAGGNLYFYWQNSSGAFQQELVAPASLN